MYMSEEEIRKSYKQAKKPKQQISILADLNCCTVEEIIAIVNPTENRVNQNKLPDIELMIQAFCKEMEKVDEEIKRLEARYTNIKGVIDALWKMAEDDARQESMA
jgi:mevalonate kinase